MRLMLVAELRGAGSHNLTRVSIDDAHVLSWGIGLLANVLANT